jgi:hypothetical protein
MKSIAGSKLLPFQGKLTSGAGEVVQDGISVVQFKLYDAPIGGNAVWAGEVHKLSVNDGLVNTILGSKTSLDNVDFSKTTYLELTIDANGDNAVTPADPPLLPRQMVLPSIFAFESLNSQKLQGGDWSALLVDQNGSPSNDPVNGLIAGGRLLESSIPGDRILGPVSGGILTPGSVEGDALVNGSVSFEKLTKPEVASDVAAGGVAISKMTESRFAIEINQATTTVPMAVPGLSVSLLTTGRPVSVKVVPSPVENSDDAPSNIGITLRKGNSANRAAGHVVFVLVRDGVDVARTRLVYDARSLNWPSGGFENNVEVLQVPVALEFMDLQPPLGKKVNYELRMNNEGSTGLSLSIQRAMIVAYEL